MKMSTLKRVSMYIGLNGAFGASCFFGVAGGVVWAANLFAFTAWIMLVLGFFSMCILFVLNVILETNGNGLDVDTQRKHLASEEKFSMPPWIDITYDVSMCVFLILCGWFGYATVIALSCGFLFITKKLIKRSYGLVRQNLIAIDVRQARQVEAEERWDNAQYEDGHGTWDSAEDAENNPLSRMGITR